MVPKMWPVSVEETLMLARSVRASLGPRVKAAGRSTRRRSPMVESSTDTLASVASVRLMTVISSTTSYSCTRT